MAYSNWGENLANSFMSMYQANNQKKLETERMGLERDRLGLERQRTEDAIKTNLLQRTQMEAEMARQREEDEFYAQHMVQGDINNDGIMEDYNARYAKDLQPYFYNSVNLPTFENGVVGTRVERGQNYNIPNLISLATGQVALGADMWNNEKNRENALVTTRMQVGATQANTAAIREETRLQRYRDASMVASNSISANGRYLTQVQKDALIRSISNGYGLSVEEATQIVESETNAFAGKQHSNGSQSGYVIKPTNGVYRNFNTPGGVRG